VVAVACAAALAAAGCSGDDDDGEEPVALPAGCERVGAPAPREEQAEPPAEQLRGPATAVVSTSCGSFEIELAAARAPKTASSFASLAEQGYYDDTPITRVVRGFVIQGGDPTGSGTGGPGYSVDEPPPDDLSYLRGTVAMAKSEVEPPGRSGSQFFVVTAPADAGLPPDYALVGRVTQGLDTVERIEQLGEPSGADGPPIAPVVVNTIEIRRG
jgi:peptidyl-prolyl cis-trans isomerase B (cyclophilin B)